MECQKAARIGVELPYGGRAGVSRWRAHLLAALGTSQSSGYPNHAVLNMTKDQLKAAPEFKFSR